MPISASKSEQEEVNIDSIIAELGFGKFQVLSYAFIVWPIFFNSITGTNFFFLVRDPQYRCDVPECSGYEKIYSPDWLPNAVPYKNGLPVKCERYSPNTTTVFMLQNANSSVDVCPKELFDERKSQPCKNWVYGEGDTIIKEFDIPCQPWMRTLVGTINSVGQFVALSFSGVLSDAIGRRNVMIFTTAASGVIGVIQSFSPEYWSFLFLEFLNAAVSSGAYSAAFILGVEILLPDKRILGTTILNSVCGISTAMLGMIAWAVPNWRNLLRVTYAPCVLVLLGLCIIPESIRWMFVKGRKIESISIVKKAAKMNKVNLSRKTLTFLDDAVKSNTKNSVLSQSNEIEHSHKIPFTDMFRSCKLLTRLIICSLCWLTNAFVYYGLALNSVAIISENDNVYLNFILVAAVELPAQVLYFACLDRIGRRLSLFLTLIGSGLSCFTFVFLPRSQETLVLITYLLGKLFISLSFSVIYVYTTELFPTTLRHSSMSCCSMIGRIGGMLAPQAPLLTALHPSLPMLCFGSTAVVSAISILTFPETSNMKLPDSIREAENIGKSCQKREDDGEGRW